MREALERLRPLASEAVLAIFQQVMSEEVEQATARDLQRALREPRRGTRRTVSAPCDGAAVSRPAVRVAEPRLMGEAGFEPAKA